VKSRKQAWPAPPYRPQNKHRRSRGPWPKFPSTIRNIGQRSETLARARRGSAHRR
jgi:hypothetical protein